MFAPAITERPILAFAAALIGCAAYAIVLFGVLSLLKATLNPLLYSILFAIPVLTCGLFHHAVTRNAAMSQGRRWLQVFASALAAPILAWYLIGFAFVIVTGEGF